MKAGYRHGLTERDVRGQVLNAQSGPGKDRLEVEMEYDPTIRNFVGAQASPPDYIYTQDRHDVQLIYLKDARIVYFQRGSLMPNSKATVTDGIPEPLESLLSETAHKKSDQAMKACWNVNAFDGEKLNICTTCCSASVTCSTTCSPADETESASKGKS